MSPSLWMMCLLLFAEGGTLSFLTTPTLLYYGRYHEPWVIGLLGSAASAAGSAIQLWLLRWALSSRHTWMRRFAPSRDKVEEAIRRYPSATFSALVLARATPLPDAPLKLVAAVAEYPITLYSLAVFLGALLAPRRVQTCFAETSQRSIQSWSALPSALAVLPASATIQASWKRP